jgi:predicted phosphoribosyltransferase
MVLMRDVSGFSRFGLGAVMCGGVTVFNGELLAELRFTEVALDLSASARSRGSSDASAGRPSDASAEVAARTVVIVDDGVETSSTLHAAAPGRR